MSRIKAYVACSLTHSPQEFKDSIDLFKSKLRKHIEVLDFIGLNNPNAQNDQFVFEWDIKHVRDADILIADFTHITIGAGIEWGVAMQIGKPIITLVKKDVVISRFPFGHVANNHFSYRYTTHDDAFEFVMNKLSIIFPKFRR